MKSFVEIRNNCNKADALARKPAARIGMLFSTVINQTCWGDKPEKINTTETAYSTTDQVIYEGKCGHYGRSYLYFRDGVLEAIQD